MNAYYKDTMKRHYNKPYPFRELRVGGYFLVTGRRVKSVRATAFNAGKRLGMIFKAEKWGQQGKVRVWREK